MRTDIPTSCLITLAAALLALPGPSRAAEISSWIVPAPLLGKQEYFSNLADGASIETPFVLKFGLTGEGLASINGVAPGTGHHHLLINRELPLDFTKPLPFNSQYMHFGKGQMESILDFAPGAYTLRLVLADNHHIPDFIYSKPIHVTVTRHNADVDPKSLVRHEVVILAPAGGEHLRVPFRIAFHASGFNISNIAVPDPGSGHFRLRLQRDGGKDAAIEFDNGHTEAWLSPPPGRYVAQLDLVDNNVRGKVLATSVAVPFDVGR